VVWLRTYDFPTCLRIIGLPLQRYRGPRNCDTMFCQKVKQTLYKPRGFRKAEAPRFPDNRHMNVKSLSALNTGRIYPPENIPGTHLSEKLSRRSIVRPKGLWKIPSTPLGIEPATFRLVVQFLKRLRYCVPPFSILTSGNHYTMKWCDIPEKRLFQPHCHEEMKTRRDSISYNSKVIIT
jgi:hypothetical protein